MTASHEEWRRLSGDELAHSALTGSAAAWDEIVRRHGRRLIVALLARGVPLDRAEDMAQETWMQLIKQQRAGRLATLQLPGLAIAQAMWLVREASRTERRHEAVVGRGVLQSSIAASFDALDPQPDAEERTIQAERLETVRNTLSQCSLRARRVFEAVYGPRGRTHEETAQEVALSVQRVRQILCETRARMRDALAELDRGGRP